MKSLLIKKFNALRLLLITFFAALFSAPIERLTNVHFKRQLNFFKPAVKARFGDAYNLTGDEIRQMDKAAYNSFDDFDGNTFDPNTFDPNMATGPGAKMPAANRPLSATAQFTVKIVNALGVDTTLEMFNFLRSVAFANNPNISAFNPWTAVSVAAATANSLIYFDQSGNLIFQDAGGLKLTISCKQVPYISLFYASAFFPFRVERMVMSFANDNSLDQDINHVVNTFLGAKKRNPITPRTYFDTTQFQSKLVNIRAPFDIDIEKGLELTILSGETLSFNMFLRKYVKPSL